MEEEEEAKRVEDRKRQKKQGKKEKKRLEKEERDKKEAERAQAREEELSREREQEQRKKDELRMREEDESRKKKEELRKQEDQLRKREEELRKRDDENRKKREQQEAAEKARRVAEEKKRLDKEAKLKLAEEKRLAMEKAKADRKQLLKQAKLEQEAKAIADRKAIELMQKQTLDATMERQRKPVKLDPTPRQPSVAPQVLSVQASETTSGMSILNLIFPNQQRSLAEVEAPSVPHLNSSIARSGSSFIEDSAIVTYQQFATDGPLEPPVKDYHSRSSSVVTTTPIPPGLEDILADDTSGPTPPHPPTGSLGLEGLRLHDPSPPPGMSGLRAAEALGGSRSENTSPYSNRHFLPGQQESGLPAPYRSSPMAQRANHPSGFDTSRPQQTVNPLNFDHQRAGNLPLNFDPFVSSAKQLGPIGSKTSSVGYSNKAAGNASFFSTSASLFPSSNAASASASSSLYPSATGGMFSANPMGPSPSLMPSAVGHAHSRVHTPSSGLGTSSLSGGHGHGLQQGLNLGPSSLNALSKHTNSVGIVGSNGFPVGLTAGLSTLAAPAQGAASAGAHPIPSQQYSMLPPPRSTNTGMFGGGGGGGGVGGPSSFWPPSASTTATANQGASFPGQPELSSFHNEYQQRHPLQRNYRGAS